MNVFVLAKKQTEIAEMQCDKHAVKMPVESGQMLSTAHRILDGEEEMRPSRSGKRMVKYFKLSDRQKERTLYKVAHPKHPSTLWTMETVENYMWHFNLWHEMLLEYLYRYNKMHKGWELFDILESPPDNIPDGPLTPLPQCMPEQYQGDNVVEAYRKFYLGEKSRFAAWNKARPAPDWYTEGLAAMDIDGVTV